MSDDPQLISKFCAVAGVTEAEGRHFLEAFGWNYEDAVQAHFDALDYDTHGDEIECPDPEPIEPNKPSRNSTKPHNKLVTFDSLRPTNQEGPEEGQAFYVGGSETGGGGQQVLGPPKKNPNNPTTDSSLSPEAFIHGVFEAARGRGAEVLDTTRYGERSGKRQGIQPFTGVGCKLGDSSSSPSVIIPGSSTTDYFNQEVQSSPTEDHNVMVKMWRDGFSLDDGPLRPYTDPGSTAFLDDIKAGNVPQELTRLADGKLVNLLLEDHHNEPWTAAPPAKLKPFSGKGIMLGHPVPKIATSANQSATSETNPISVSAPDVDQSQPITRIQIRLPNGDRLQVQLNHTHTVGDVRRAIVSQRPNLAASTFTMMTAFPSRELKNDSQTVQDAQILGSSLLLRMT